MALNHFHNTFSYLPSQGLPTLLSNQPAPLNEEYATKLATLHRHFDNRLLGVLSHTPSCFESTSVIPECDFANSTNEKIEKCIKEAKDVKQKFECTCTQMEDLRTLVSDESLDRCTDLMCVGSEEDMRIAREITRGITDPELITECWGVTRQMGSILGGSSGSSIRVGKGAWVVGALAIAAVCAM